MLKHLPMTGWLQLGFPYSYIGMNVLFLGCHCDDIELGCGATISSQKDWDVHCATLCPCEPKGTHLFPTHCNALKTLGVEANRITEAAMLTRDLNRQSVWEFLTELNQGNSFDLIFCTEDDGHVDHRVLKEETLRVFTGKSVILYSPTKKLDSNYYFRVSKSDVEAKLNALKCYEIYKDKPYFQTDYIKARMVVDGFEAKTNYAESFVLHRGIQ